MLSVVLTQQTTATGAAFLRWRNGVPAPLECSSAQWKSPEQTVECDRETLDTAAVVRQRMPNEWDRTFMPRA
jgi:hypothetical protein